MQGRQAASSLDHDRAAGYSGDNKGESDDCWLMLVMLARTIPVIRSSTSEELSSGLVSKAARIGEETQAGGASVFEYPGRTLDMAGILLFWLMGESCLLENVSGMTWSFPGMCFTLNLYIIDFSFTFMILGFGISAKFCLSPRIASNGL